MTRELHSETEVQRAESADVVSSQDQERGYEPSDAPAKKIALGAAGLFGLMVTGLVVCALLVSSLRNQAKDPVLPFAAIRIVPPEPRLLTSEAPSLDHFRQSPVRVETTPDRIERAMRRVEQRGWGEAQPPPATQDIAREHAKTSQ